VAVALTSISCFVADDHPAVLRFVCELLRTHDLAVVGSSSSGTAALEQIVELDPDVAILDAHMPGLSGGDVARELNRRRARTRVILYTGYADQPLLLEALDAGANGFVRKEAPVEDLLAAIRCVAAGESYVDPVLGAALVRRGTLDRLPELTSRERNILRLLADGLSNEAIGQQLVISPHTVRTHITKAMRKLDADTRTQAVALAIRQSLIN
jgi:two-component system response regulator DevR